METDWATKSIAEETKSGAGGEEGEWNSATS
jgi:hypothetical protein